MRLSVQTAGNTRAIAGVARVQRQFQAAISPLEELTRWPGECL
jgi:hypothetical protein